MKHFILILFVAIFSSCSGIHDIRYLASVDTENLDFRTANRKNRISIFQQDSFSFKDESIAFNSLENQKPPRFARNPSKEQEQEVQNESSSDILAPESDKVVKEDPIEEAQEDVYPKESNPKFTFPIVVNEATALNLHLNKTRTIMTITPEPQDKKLQIIAAFDGVISFRDNRMILSSPEKANDFVLKFDKDVSEFDVQEGDAVKLGQPLGHAQAELMFSLKRHGALSPLCIVNLQNKSSFPVDINYTADDNREDPCQPALSPNS